MPRQKEKIFEIDEHITKRFDIQKRLGKGAYGIVWKAVDRKTKEVVAVKKIFDAFRNQTDAQRTFREIMFLKSLKNHPNIIQLHSIHRAANNNDIYLGFEYMEIDLHNVIKRGILKDVHKRYIMYQLFKALKYIHSGNIIHRDLKPSNILLDIMCRCKIADFGLARSLSQYQDGSVSDTDPSLTDYVATRWYRAPEILVASKRYTKGIDMWSLGCILGEIIAGKPLFPGSSTVNQVEKIMASIPTPSDDDIHVVCVSGIGSSMIRNASAVEKVPLQTLLGKNLKKEELSLINNLLVFSPNRRLTAERALEHEYVRNFHDPDQEITLKEDIIIPFNDDIRLSVEDYRNKLYEIMSRHYYHHQPAVIYRSSLTKTKPMITNVPSKTSKHSEITKVPPSTKKEKSYITASESKISYSSKNNHFMVMNRSEPKIIKQTLQFPRTIHTINKVPIRHIPCATHCPESCNKRRFSTKRDNFVNCNNYHQTHGVISKNTLMELKSSGLR